MGPINIGNLIKFCRNPARMPVRANRFLNSMLMRYKYGEGINVMGQDWDNLIILDACRYDFFKEVNHLPGDLEKVVSTASHSAEFMNKNFVGGQFHDTIYVTANRWADRLLEDDTFFMVEATAAEGEHKYDVDWAERHPENVVKLALDTADSFRNKRYIIHFMQPHAQYFGPQAQKFREQLTQQCGVSFIKSGPDTGTDTERQLTDLKEAYEDGLISREQLHDVYRENLEFVLGYVEEMIDELGGKTVITADHGEMLGDRLPPLFIESTKHPGHTYSDPLRNVPWFVIDSEERRDIRTDTPIGFDRLDEEVVEDQLKAMGYLSG